MDIFFSFPIEKNVKPLVHGKHLINKGYGLKH